MIFKSMEFLTTINQLVQSMNEAMDEPEILEQKQIVHLESSSNENILRNFNQLTTDLNIIHQSSSSFVHSSD